MGERENDRRVTVSALPFPALPKHSEDRMQGNVLEKRLPFYPQERVLSFAHFQAEVTVNWESGVGQQ